MNEVEALPAISSAAGLLAIKKNGGQTIAQDEASSTVFGMPGEAIALGAAQVIAPLADVAGTLRLMARRSGGEVLNL